MKNTVFTLFAFAMTTTMARAEADDPILGDGKGGAVSVPEISALEGTAALAAIVAVLLLVWERRRRVA